MLELARQGFKTILGGPRHPSDGAFGPAPRQGSGFNDRKVIEAAGLLRAILRSAAERRWVDVAAVEA